ncbi:MAG TPA: protein-disulfide reductase DsbD domain-containing protein [Burkholderiales bacterium]
MWLGLLIRHQPAWHTYWRNPGDSGLPTMLKWALPAGVKAGEIDWPTPVRLPVGSLLNYGYEGTVLLPVPVRLPADFASNTLDINLRADWLVCKIECIPESGDFTLSLPTNTPIRTHEKAFAAAFAARPVELPGVKAVAQADAGAIVLRVEGLPARLVGKRADVFAETIGLIEHAAPLQQRWHGDAW